ncbi:MAG: hypothetical protein R6U96_18575 [Promethearchaeia archaeon]
MRLSENEWTIPALMEPNDAEETIYFCTVRDAWFLFIIFILLLGFTLYLLINIYKNREKRLELLRAYYMFIIFAFIICAILLIFLLRVLKIQIVEGNKNSGILFAGIVSLLFLVWINVTFGKLFENDSLLVKWVLIVFVLYITLGTNFGTVGFRIVFNTDVVIPGILQYYVFESNSRVGIEFMFNNLGTLLIIWGGSIIIKSF